MGLHVMSCGIECKTPSLVCSGKRARSGKFPSDGYHNAKPGTSNEGGGGAQKTAQREEVKSPSLQ